MANTVTQDDLDFLAKTYGGTNNINVGDSLGKLTQSYVALNAGTDAAKGDDPVRDKLVSGGWILPAVDTQGNPGWSYGSTYEDAVDKMAKTPGALNQMYAPTGGFGNYGTMQYYQPGGGTMNIPLLKAVGPALSDAKSSSFSGVNPVGQIDPLTGVQQYDWSKAVPHIQSGSMFDRMLGPAIGAALGMGMGGLGMFGPNGLGGLGRMLFNTGGNMMLGGKPNLTSLGSSLALKYLLPYLKGGA